jgi:hypothetical protein
MFCITQYCAGDKIKEKVMGVERHVNFVGGEPEEKDHWGDQGINGRIILRYIF